MSGRPLRVLMVCTGNICRSPVMERLLAARLASRLTPAERADFEIASAGTYAMVGSAMAPDAAKTLEALGAHAAGFVSRDLDVTMVQAADLVLTATREHRSLVVGAEPRAGARTVTLRELTRLLRPVTVDAIDAATGDGDAVDRFRAIVAAGLANRGRVPPGDPKLDDIADPYRRGRKAYARATAEIDAALGVPLGLMFPAGRP